jgi:hypothetical protein
LQADAARMTVAHESRRRKMSSRNVVGDVVHGRRRPARFFPRRCPCLGPVPASSPASTCLHGPTCESVIYTCSCAPTQFKATDPVFVGDLEAVFYWLIVSFDLAPCTCRALQVAAFPIFLCKSVIDAPPLYTTGIHMTLPRASCSRRRPESSRHSLYREEALGTAHSSLSFCAESNGPHPRQRCAESPI